MKRPDPAAANEWVRQAALNDLPLRKPSRVLSRFGLMACIFAVGTAVGVTAAWWMNTQSPPAARMAGQGAATAPIYRAPPSPSASTVRTAPASTAAAKGITPSELPYDGAPPSGTQEAPAIALKQTTPEELPYGAMSSGSSAGESDQESQSSKEKPSVQPQERPLADATQNAPQRQTPKPAAPVAATPAPASVANVTPKRTERTERSERTERKVAARQSVQRVAKDKEIQRIKQQAADELKKKIERRQSDEASLKRAPESGQAAHKTASVRAMLARCESAPNFIFREQCKWQLCSGKWGKNGCPSYQTHASSY